MDVETAERQINAFVEKRAAGREAANRAEESWKEPTRRRRRQERRENAQAWAAHYQNMARAHHDMAASAAAKADYILELLEDENGEEA